jgi:hypothetical protein
MQTGAVRFTWGRRVVRRGDDHTYGVSRRWWSAALRAVSTGACLGCFAATATQVSASTTATRATGAKSHFACNGGAKVPCRFSTPSGNIRCLWTPKPNNVACELLSSRRAYRLRPTGKAKRVSLKLTRHGDTLPTNQTVVFLDSLSCQDTKTTMTCNQDFGSGAFTLSPNGSHRS